MQLQHNITKGAIIIEINSCKNNCIFCGPNRAKNTKRQVSKEELEDIAGHILKQATDLKSKGIREIELSGCDPIEYPKIASFISWLKKDMRFNFVRLSTHGRDLHDVRLVKSLKNVRLDEVRIPLYGSKAVIHNSVTREKNSFGETYAGIKNIKKYAPKINIFITSLIMQQNYKDILKTFLFASRYAHKFLLSIPCVPPKNDGGRFIVSFQKIRLDLLKLLYISKKFNCPLTITDIPFCVFGFYRSNIINVTGPPITSSAYSIPLSVRSNIPNLPSYRVKKKLGICHNCKLALKCDGFYNSYINLLKLDYLRPL